MPPKMTVTETVTAELLPQLPPLRGAMADDGGGARGGVSGAVTDAVVDAGVTVEGAAPPLSLGEQMLALSTASRRRSASAITRHASQCAFEGSTSRHSADLCSRRSASCRTAKLSASAAA